MDPRVDAEAEVFDQFAQANPAYDHALRSNQVEGPDRLLPLARSVAGIAVEQLLVESRVPLAGLTIPEKLSLGFVLRIVVKDDVLVSLVEQVAKVGRLLWRMSITVHIVCFRPVAPLLCVCAVAIASFPIIEWSVLLLILRVV